MPNMSMGERSRSWACPGTKTPMRRCFGGAIGSLFVNFDRYCV